MGGVVWCSEVIVIFGGGEMGLMEVGGEVYIGWWSGPRYEEGMNV